MSNQFPPPGYVRAKSTLNGIELFMPAPVVERQEEVVEFRCPQCNGETAYAVDGGLTCAYCGYHEPAPMEVVGKGAEEFEFTVETVKRSAHGWGLARQELQCQNCGAMTSVPPGDLSHTCPFLRVQPGYPAAVGTGAVTATLSDPIADRRGALPGECA